MITRFLFILALAITAKAATANLVYDTVARVAQPTNLIFKYQFITNSWIDGVSSAAIATNSAANKLDITNGVAVNLTGSLTNVTLDGRASQRVSYLPGATTLYTLGDSIAYGASADSYSTSWAALFAATNNWTEQRLAYGGGEIIDYYWQACRPFHMTNWAGSVIQAPTNLSSSFVWAVGMGDYNGMRDFGTTAAYNEHRRRAYESLVVMLSTPTKTHATNATASGTWTTITNLNGGLAATNTSATLTFTNIVGDVVYLAYMATASNDFSGISITVDGVSYGSWPAVCYGNRPFYFGTNGITPAYVGPNNDEKLWFMPYVARIPVGGMTEHTIVVTASAATIAAPSCVLWAAGNGQAVANEGGPLVFASDTLRQATYTGSGSDAAAGLASATIADVVGLIHGDGFNVYLARAAQVFDPFTMMGVDTVHPAQSGHTAIAGAFQDAYVRATLGREPVAGRIATGASIGRSPATSGSLRLSANDSIVWRGSGINGPAITNSGNTLGIYAPNGAASVQRSYIFRGDDFPMFQENYSTLASADVVAHEQTATISGSSGDVSLNKITTTISTTGTGGFIGYDVLMTDTSTSTGTHDAFRAKVGGRYIFEVTKSGGLVIDTATNDVAATARFGTFGTSDYAIQLTYGGNGADRRLQLGGNSIQAIVNSTGSSANLSIGLTGTTTAIQGGASVAQTLGVTGVTTLSGTLLAYPTPASGGVTHRFGQSGTANSAVHITASDAATDRRMNITGNSIWPSVNSTGVNANMALGTSGTSVLVQGAASVAQTFGVTGVTTLSDQLLVYPVADSDGTTHRFGEASTTNSAINIVASSTALDRRLNLSGNSIDALVNSTGAAANLSLAASGGTVVTGGPIDLGNSDTTLARSAAGKITVESVPVALSPSTETLAYSSTTVTVTAGKGPNQSSVLTCTNNFTLSFSSVADNDGGTIWVHPAATNCTVTLSSPAYGPSGTTLTITGGTGSTNHTVLAWKATTVNSTNVINVNALNYYR